jgi:transcriptional regulator with XRE-family HTH domain
MSPLRAARQRKGLSLEKLAAEAGVSKQTLWNAEKTPSRLTDKTAAAVAPFLGVEPKELFRMSLPVIDLTDTAKTIKPARGDARAAGTLAVLERADRIAASLGVLGGLSDPEDPMQQRQLLMGLLGSARRPLTPGDDAAWLITSPKGRSFVMVLDANAGGEAILAFVHELEWRLGRGELELEIYARPPEVIQ